MTTSTKNVNYTPAMVSEIVETMAGVKNHADQVAAVIMLASSTGKTIRSLNAKISNLSRIRDDVTFYGKEKGKTKTGGKVESKAEKVTRLASLLAVEESQIESLEKGTKIALDILLDALSPKLSDDLSDLPTSLTEQAS